MVKMQQTSVIRSSMLPSRVPRVSSHAVSSRGGRLPARRGRAVPSAIAPRGLWDGREGLVRAPVILYSAGTGLAEVVPVCTLLISASFIVSLSFVGVFVLSLDLDLF